MTYDHDRETQAALLILACIRVAGRPVTWKELGYIAGHGLPPLPKDTDGDEAWGHAKAQLRARKMIVENLHDGTYTLGENADIIPRHEPSEESVRKSRKYIAKLGLVPAK